MYQIHGLSHQIHVYIDALAGFRVSFAVCCAVVHELSFIAAVDLHVRLLRIAAPADRPSAQEVECVDVIFVGCVFFLLKCVHVILVLLCVYMFFLFGFPVCFGVNISKDAILCAVPFKGAKCVLTLIVLALDQMNVGAFLSHQFCAHQDL